MSFSRISLLAVLFSLSAAAQINNGVPTQVGNWCKYTVANSTTNLQITDCTGATSLVAKAGAVTQSVTLTTLAANTFIEAVRIKTSTAFVGPTTLVCTLGATGSLTYFTSVTYDMKAAVSATNFATATGLAVGIGAPTTASVALVLALTATIDNITTISTGSVDVWVKVAVLP